MTDILFRRLGNGLSPASQLRLREITAHPRHVGPRKELAQQGEASPTRHFVLEGIACRYKLLAGGRRAILAFLLPGDFCEPHPDFDGRLDYSLATLTHASIAEVPYHLLQDALSAGPDLAKALNSACWVQAAIQRQWLANMACPADKRVAHLFCELRTRLAQVGLADARSFPLALTQHELSEAVGISTVHVNRVLQHLKDLGLLRLMDKRAVITDLAMLESFADFDPAYLALTVPEAGQFAIAG
jgi:CRP-like cAMP-binding protein